ncbi:hypothetical protein ACPA2M_26845 [Ectopseudomonas chengduensis]
MNSVIALIDKALAADPLNLALCALLVMSVVLLLSTSRPNK